MLLSRDALRPDGAGDLAPTRVKIEENRRSLQTSPTQNEIEKRVPDTARQKASVFICIARLKEVLIELSRHPVPEFESLV